MTGTAIAAPRQISTSRSWIIAAIVLFIYIELFASRLTGVPMRSALDALVILLAALILAEAFIRRRITALHIVLVLNIATFTCLSMFGALKPDFLRSLLSAIIFSKFLIVFMLAPNFRMADLRVAMAVLAIVHIAGCLANLVFPAYFTALLPQLSYELDTSRLMGFSLNANRSASVSMVLFLYYMFVERRVLFSFLFVVFIILSGSRSLTVITALVAGYIFLNSGGSFAKRSVAIVVVAVSAVLILATLLSPEETGQVIRNTLYGDLRYVRAAMLRGGYFLANEFFPLGVGGGQFGSSMSVGSEAYRMVGISHWATVVDMTGVFDSGIGSILGEYGYLGLLLYSLFSFLAVKKARDFRSSTIVGAFIVTLVLFMNLFRTVASDFFYSFFFLFCYALVARIHYLRDRTQR